MEESKSLQVSSLQRERKEDTYSYFSNTNILFVSIFFQILSKTIQMKLFMLWCVDVEDGSARIFRCQLFIFFFIFFCRFVTFFFNFDVINSMQVSSSCYFLFFCSTVADETHPEKKSVCIYVYLCMCVFVFQLINVYWQEY